MKIFKQVKSQEYVRSILKNAVAAYLEYVFEVGKSVEELDVPDDLVDAFHDSICGEHYLIGKVGDYKIEQQWDSQDTRIVFNWFKRFANEEKKVAIKGIHQALTENGEHLPEVKFWNNRESKIEYIGRELCSKFLEKVNSVRRRYQYASGVRDLPFLIALLADAYCLKQYEPEKHTSEQLLDDLDRIIEKDD